MSFLGSIYIAIRQTKQVGISSAFGAAINLLICVIAIKYIGLYAAAIASAVSYLLICVYRIIDLRKYIVFRLDKKMIFQGAGYLAVAFSLFYLNQNVMFVVGVVLTAMFNLGYNKALVKMVFWKKPGGS